MKVVLGCMDLGRRFPSNQAAELLEHFLKNNKELDTAYMYCDGESEKILGKNKDLISRNKGLIATKINPTDDGFNVDNFINRFNISLQRLESQSVHTLYLHWPCKKFPLEPILDVVNKLYREEKFHRLGISNYSSWEVVKIINYCEKNGYVKPTVYQGMYNCLTRDVERELFPCLREYGLSFYAFNPLAGGLLTGKYNHDDLQKFDSNIVNRFHGTGGSWSKAYQDRFWNKSYFNAIDLIKQNLSPQRTLLQTSFDWLVHHSQLKSSAGDAIILGFSSMNQYLYNLNAICDSKPLNSENVEIIDQSYKFISGCCPSYFRYNQ